MGNKLLDSPVIHGLGSGRPASFVSLWLLLLVNLVVISTCLGCSGGIANRGVCRPGPLLIHRVFLLAGDMGIPKGSTERGERSTEQTLLNNERPCFKSPFLFLGLAVLLFYKSIKAISDISKPLPLGGFEYVIFFCGGTCLGYATFLFLSQWQ